MDMALRRLLDAKIIDGDDAYLKARNKADFERFREGFEDGLADEDGATDTGE